MKRKWIYPVLLGVVCVAVAQAGDWPQFRGPNNTGMSEEKQLPDEWSATKNVLWKAKLPGYGWSSPIVWGDRVFVTTAVSDKQTRPSPGFGGFGRGDRPGGPGGGFPPRPPADGQRPGRPGGGWMGRDRKPPDAVYQFEVCCLNRADGKVLWKQVAAERKPTISTFPSNGYASETPVTDGERVYAYFGMHGVYCYDLNGKLLWSKDLGSYRMAFGHGTGSSPALDGGRLFVQCDNEEKSFLVAFDGKTGKELWRVPRAERSGWSTPLVWKNRVRTEVVCLGPGRARSYDPATGKQLWELGGLTGQPQASPVADDERVYLGTGGNPFARGGASKPLFAVKAGATGDITLKDDATSNEAVAWYLPQGGPSIASPLLYEGRLYVLEQRSGMLSCYDAKTGKQAYRERLPGARGFTSSPWAGEGKVFCLADDGQTYVLQAGPDFKLLGRNSIGEMCWSSPAIARGALLLRTVDQLYCIKK
jgi:outer membrane protein assembly factor BamB